MDPPHTHSLLLTEMPLIKYGGKLNSPMGTFGGGPDRYNSVNEQERLISMQDDGRKFL